MPPLAEWLDVSLRSAAVYLALLAGLRLAGKRHAGQLSPHDFVLILLVSNAVQNAMVGENMTLHGGLVAAGTLIVLNTLISRFVLHNRRLEHLVAGQPTLLVHNGVVVWEHLEREGIRPDELDAQLRAHGFDRPDEVKSAVQECDGTISVIGFGSRQELRMPAIRKPNHQRQKRHRHR